VARIAKKVALVMDKLYILNGGKLVCEFLSTMDDASAYVWSCCSPGPDAQRITVDVGFSLFLSYYHIW